MASTKKQSPRQKMINLMYLVFIAMLALNVSTEVLDGFEFINDNIQASIQNINVRNNQIYKELEESNARNPEKTAVSFEKSQKVKLKTDSLFNYLQYLKVEIAKKSDGEDADVNNLKFKDNSNAASELFISPGGGQGEKLKTAIDNYRNEISSLITDSAKMKIIQNGLSTNPTLRAKNNNKSWIQASFEGMPSIATLTYLSELQANVKQAEGEALLSILREIDFSDFRVNDLSAYVIPESNFVLKGDSYKASIVLAAVDTTQRPRVIINGREVPNGKYQVGAGSAGKFSFKGFVEMMNRDGSKLKKEFSQEYTVMEPMATVSSDLMDVVYAGYDNPISISVPGIPDANVAASATGGSFVKRGNKWIARPTQIGQEFVITVSTNSRVVARKVLRTRALPDPTAFMQYTDDAGNPKSFKRGTLSRTVLLNAKAIRASIDDGILNIPFTVLSFSTLLTDAMNNGMIEVSAGSSFSSRQLEQIRRMERGKRLIIVDIKVKGPDGLVRDISSMDIKVN